MNIASFHSDFENLAPKEPDFLENEALCMKDYDYMKKLYPKEERLIASVLEEYMDRFEYEGSPIYAQYPDSVTVYRIASEIWKQMAWDENDRDKDMLRDLIQVMVCQEIYVRRRRHDHFCRKFKYWNR